MMTTCVAVGFVGWCLSRDGSKCLAKGVRGLHARNKKIRHNRSSLYLDRTALP